MPTKSINEIIATLGTTAEQFQRLIKRSLARIPRAQYYVFRITGAQGSRLSANDQPRTVTAFPSPDDALAFAQRNGYGSNAQLRSINAIDLILLLLSDPSIGTVLFLESHTNEQTRGFGPGLRLTRDELLLQLNEPVPEHPPELSAKQYDALQFGVDFTRRAEFRAALTEAIENIIRTYEPPPGSLDQGPRSIFAIGAIEDWLKRNGFPHAHQRRWIDIAHDPAWNGAAELCEIDAGTANRLLIQLVIHEDETNRQYIKWVNVTP